MYESSFMIRMLLLLLHNYLSIYMKRLCVDITRLEKWIRRCMQIDSRENIAKYRYKSPPFKYQQEIYMQLIVDSDYNVTVASRTCSVTLKFCGIYTTRHAGRQKTTICHVTSKHSSREYLPVRDVLPYNMYKQNFDVTLSVQWCNGDSWYSLNRPV